MHTHCHFWAGSCVPPRIEESIRSDSLVIQLRKYESSLPNFTTFYPQPKVVEVAPSANYDIKFTDPLLIVKGNARFSQWVRLSAGWGTASGYARERTVYFNTSGIIDGANLGASLTFSGSTARENKLAASVPIEISAMLECAPSLDKSTMDTGNAFEVTAGQSVEICIDAKDHEGMPITSHRGRYFTVKWSRADVEMPPKFSEFQEGRFLVSFSGVDLEDAGDYELYIDSWNLGSEGFQYSPESSLSLPTKNAPYRLKVISTDTTLSIILGALVGAVCAACACLLIYHARKHPKQAMQARSPST